MRVLLIAYSCDPGRGSEYKIGWRWFATLDARPELDVTLVTSQSNRDVLQRLVAADRVIFVDDSVRHAERLPSTLGETARYLAFLRRSKSVVQHHVATSPVDVAHHVSWGNVRLDSPAFVAGAPVVFGPVGGAQRFPWRFARAVRGSEALLEMLRNVHVLGSRWRPSVRRRLRRAALVVAANDDTAVMARSAGARQVDVLVDLAIDGAAPTEPADAPPRPPLRLIWVGRLLARKGIGLALDAVRLASEDIDVELLIVGDGQDAELVEAAIDRGDPVRWLGMVPHEELAELYQSAHALLYTSLRDTGAPPMAEALSYGLPALALDHQGPGAYATGEWAERVEVTDPVQTASALATAIVRLADEGTLARRSAAVPLRARQLTWEQYGEQAIGWYERVTGRSAS